MKWLLFLLSLIFLFAANNALFWAPGSYDWLNFTAAGIGILLAAVLAWLSSRRFVRTVPGVQHSWRDIAMAPPLVVWFIVISLFLLGGVIKMIGYLVRH
jgi:hypothetical protein